MQALSLIVLLVFLATYVAGNQVSAQADFVAYRGITISDSAIDDNIGAEWADAGAYTNVAIDPSGTAEVWTKQDGTYLYIAIRFTADSADPWVAFQLGATGCMDDTADMPIFGDNGVAANGYSDAHLSGNSIIADAVQNGVGALNVTGGYVVTIELKKPLNSGDTVGKDIAWIEGNTYNLVIAWDSNGGGSSGGTTSHKSGTLTARSVLLSGNPIPEFTGVVLIAVLILAIFAAAVMAKKMSSRRTLPVPKAFP